MPAGKRVKLRILNVGTFGMYRISMDNHPYEIVEVDDTAVYGPSGVHEAQVAAGQRMSVVINTDQGKPGDAWWFRVNIVTSGSKTSFGLA